jgi:hypothetical protein
MMKTNKNKAVSSLLSTLTGTGLLLLGLTGNPLFAAPSGAAFTTFNVDPTSDSGVTGGCLDNQTGINCNHYEKKRQVFMSGGPIAAGLEDGDYYFAVLVPGFQNDGFDDEKNGNLSDYKASIDKKNGSVSGAGLGDDKACRTFKVYNHNIVITGNDYNTSGCSHSLGKQKTSGRDIIQLWPYDNTTNPGGVYILAVCQVNAADPSQCKYDAFHTSDDELPDNPS